jgi:hypothetical protein
MFIEYFILIEVWIEFRLFHLNTDNGNKAQPNQRGLRLDGVLGLAVVHAASSVIFVCYLNM